MMYLAKFSARNATRLDNAGDAIRFLEEIGDFDAIESLASYAKRDGTCLLAIDALERNKQFDRIINSIFYTLQKKALNYALGVLIRNGRLGDLYRCEQASSHRKETLAGINNMLNKAILQAIEKKDLGALISIARSKVLHLQNTNKGAENNYEIARIESAIGTNEIDELIGIAQQIRGEFAEEMSKRPI